MLWVVLVWIFCLLVGLFRKVVVCIVVFGLVLLIDVICGVCVIIMCCWLSWCVRG